MKTIVLTLLISTLLLAAAAVAFIYSGIYDVGASSPHGGLSSWVLETTMHSSVERRADRVEVPELADRSLVLAGVNDFEQMCVQCHGAPGREPAALGKGLNPPAPDLSESAQEMSAAELFWITKHGIRMTGMPAWGTTHDDEELWPVVAFLTELPQLDAAAYDALLESAEGVGHHADDTASGGHAHPAGEQPTEAHQHDESAATPESGEHDHREGNSEHGDSEHDHGSHEH